MESIYEEGRTWQKQHILSNFTPFIYDTKQTSDGNNAQEYMDAFNDIMYAVV